jgi:hypothetical protein
MGIEIDRERFDDADYPRFTERLEHCLQALEQLLQRPGFGVGPRTIGAELELFLIDDQGRPLTRNQAILEDAGDPRLTLELDRFNLEVNPSPTPLAGRPLTSLGHELEGALESVRATARAHGGRAAMVGILPTLRDEDLHRGAITNAPRYRALDWSLSRAKAEPFEIEIAARDGEPLRVVRDNIVMEGANTSFQVHLRVDPDDYVGSFNAAQLATAPVLAAAGNSPLFLGRVLWEETRIALFEQAADDRDTPGRERLVSRVAFGTDWLRTSVLDLFEESVRHHEPLLPIIGDQDPLLALGEGDGVPRLDELRLHQGTVWRWNRAIYDSGFGGHLRIEMRPLPAGPTVVDMLANAAFLLGLTLALVPSADDWTGTLLFARAHASFYDAARLGLEAELAWPGAGGPERVGAAELVGRLLPEARRGLVEAGVDAAEADRLLGVVGDRVAAGQTGAVWQRRTLAALEGGRTDRREQALGELLERYLELQAAGDPVHTWPVEG